MNTFRLTQEQIILLKSGTAINVSGQTFYSLPFWYKETNKEGIFEIIKFGDEPEPLKSALDPKNITGAKVYLNA
jgi:hypothetical protein